MLSDEASLSDEEYLRYGRQLMLAEIGEDGQVRLKGKLVLIVHGSLAAISSRKCRLPLLAKLGDNSEKCSHICSHDRNRNFTN